MKRALLVGFALGCAMFAILGDTCAGAGTNGTNSQNIDTFCDHGNRVYDDQSGHGVAVVPQDPTCGKQ